MSSFDHSNPGSGSGKSRYSGTFLLALREALAKLGWQATSWKTSSVECTDAQGKSQQIGMENMYRRLRHEPRANWPELIAELLGSVPPEATTPPGDLREIADRLLVRLGPPFTRKDVAVDVWNLPLAGDQLAASMVIDYPTSMSYVTEKMIVDSGQDATYWYERAIANLRGKSDVGCMIVVHEESGLLQAQAADAYDSSRALMLDVLVPGHEENGFYVVLPSRDHLLVLPITAETMPMAPWLRAIASKTYREMPYPISPELFWVRLNKWHHFVIESDGDNLIVKPLRTLNEMQHEVNRVFDRWGHRPFGVGEFPAINLWEEDEAIRLEAELPGLEIADLELFVTGHNQFTLKGERKPLTFEKGVQHRQERPFGKFSRTVTLPFDVDENRVEAKFENGILKVRLPKHEAAKPRKITIKM